MGSSIFWGANGHLDQGAPYTTTPISTQANDLHTIFGAGEVIYRAFGDASLAPATVQSGVSQLQSDGIQPIVGVDTYPTWGSFSSMQAAYQWAYNEAASYAQGSSAKYFEIGNEWSADSTDFPSSDNQMTAGAWTGGPNFQDAVAVTAGAIAAIRQYDPSAQIIGGAGAGWTQEGFEVALAQALQSEYPNVGMWDLTALHWYNDVAGGGSQMGNTPSNFDGGQNAYAALLPIGKPIAITEFGSSDGGNSANDAQAAANITAMMQNFEQNAAPSATSPGIALATYYELYPNGGGGYFADSRPGTESAQGQALQSEVASLGGNVSSPPPSSGTPSPNDTTITPGNGTIIDSSGNTWTITSAGTIDMNGAPAGYSNNVIQGAYVNNTVWQENNQDNWWSWTNGGWQAGSDPLPASGGGSTGGAGSFTPSPNDTVITPGSGSITDAKGDVFTITNAGTVDMNGSALGYTNKVIEGAYVNGNFWQENSSDLWWEYSGNPASPWSGAGTSTTPLPASGGGTGGNFTPSPNDTVITPGSGSITDAKGDVFTITSAGTVDMNGSALGFTQNVTEGAYVSGNFWQENNQGLWWEYTGNPSSPWTGLGTSTSPLPPGDPVINGVDYNQIQFIGGRTPGTDVIYDSAKNVAVDVSSKAVPTEFDIGAGMTGTLEISDFRLGIDSIALQKGLKVTDEASSKSSLVFTLSNHAHVAAAFAHH